MVLLNERLSDLVAKGEPVPRYYNPEATFDKIAFVLTNDDRPDPDSLRSLTGDAEVTVDNIPLPPRSFRRTCGWRPRLLRPWARAAVEIARHQPPALVRCYGVGFNSFAASEIKRQLGIPYVVSLHGNPDVDYGRGRLGRTLREKLAGHAIDTVEVQSLRSADVVLPVYSPIVPYLENHAIREYEVVYNAVGYDVKVKTNYSLNPDRVEALCVGRQQALQKDPTPIIDAVADLPQVHLTLIGDGDLHAGLVERSRRLGVTDRVSFVRAMPNNAVLAELQRADLYVYSSINYEISKTCIEAALTGLPIILNDRKGDPAEELMGGHFRLVSGSADSYRRAIDELIRDEETRASLGRKAREHAERHWEPKRQEARVAEIYRELAAGRAPALRPPR